MPTLAVQGDIDTVDIGHGVTGTVADLSGCQCRRDVQGDGKIRFGKALEQVILKHRPGTGTPFLGGLANQHDGPFPQRFVGCQIAGHADEVGHMDVMPAGVHHADFSTIFIHGVYPGSKG